MVAVFDFFMHDLSLEGNGQRWGKWQVHCLEEEKKDVMNTVDSIL